MIAFSDVQELAPPLSIQEFGLSKSETWLHFDASDCLRCLAVHQRAADAAAAVELPAPLELPGEEFSDEGSIADSASSALSEAASEPPTSPPAKRPRLDAAAAAAAAAPVLNACPVCLREGCRSCPTAPHDPCPPEVEAEPSAEASGCDGGLPAVCGLDVAPMEEGAGSACGGVDPPPSHPGAPLTLTADQLARIALSRAAAIERRRARLGAADPERPASAPALHSQEELAAIEAQLFDDAGGEPAAASAADASRADTFVGVNFADGESSIDLTIGDDGDDDGTAPQLVDGPRDLLNMASDDEAGDFYDPAVRAAATVAAAPGLSPPPPPPLALAPLVDSPPLALVPLIDLVADPAGAAAQRMGTLLEDGKQAVRSLGEAHRWMFHFVEAMYRQWGDGPATEALERLRDSIARTTVSTAFSGVDAPGTALEIISKVIAVKLNLHVPPAPPPHVFAIEWSLESQQELLVHPSKATCLFGDISTFFTDPVKLEIQRHKKNTEVSFDWLKHLVLSGTAVQRYGHCIMHDRKCRIECSKHHTAGTNCRPFSPQGAQRGTADKSIVHTMAWVGLMRLLQPATILHENVPKFPQKLFDEMLSDLYEVAPDQTYLELASSDLGWADKRIRAIRALRHRRKVVKVLEPFAAIAPMFTRICRFNWRQYWVYGMDAPEVLAELEWCLGRPSSLAANKEMVARMLGPDATEHELALSEAEAQRYMRYRESHPDRCYMVGQNPDEHPHMSDEQERLPTIIRKVHILMSHEHGRWLTPRELMCAAGFPVWPILAELSSGRPGHVCSFTTDRDRDRGRFAQQSGDTMNVNMIAVGLIYQLGFTLRMDHMVDIW